MKQYNKTIQRMVNFDHFTITTTTTKQKQKQKNIKEHNSNWLPILDHLYRILIIGGSQSGKTN